MDAFDVRDARPLKRTRQACEPCRRKKSKCSGERPICTTCNRLQQVCSYTLEQMEAIYETTLQRDIPAPEAAGTRMLPAMEAPSENRWQDRLETLESTMADVLRNLRNGPPSWSTRLSSMSQSREGAFDSSPSVPQHPSSADTFVSMTRTSLSLPPDLPAVPPQEVLLRAAELYLTYCDSQPLPLFCRQNFVSTFAKRDTEVIFAVLTLTSRVMDKFHPGQYHHSGKQKSFADAASRLAMSRVASRNVELSTLQALVLLALQELYNGDMDQCHMHCSLVMSLTVSAQLNRPDPGDSDDSGAEERRRCYWSIVLLRRLLGECVPTTSSPALPECDAATPMEATSPEGQRLAASLDLDQREGIVAVILRLSEVWSSAQVYVRTQKLADRGPLPWSPESGYFKAMAMLMETTQKLTPLHRYRLMRLSSITARDLEESRGYWAPWFLSRFLYHTTMCILHHPLLIMLQLQGNKGVSEVFLQQCLFSLSHHTNWVLHFMEYLESRSFYISDPIVGYCATVVATIELQQSFSEEEGSIRTSRRRNYDRCLRFVYALRQNWPVMEQVVLKLQKLDESLSISHQTNITQPGNNISISISDFMELLDLRLFYAVGSQSSARSSIFGPTLSHHLAPRPAKQANLTRLPRITAIERTSSANAERDAREQSTTGSSVPIIPPNNTFHDQDAYHDLQLPADQFFSINFQNIHNWDFMLGPHSLNSA